MFESEKVPNPAGRKKEENKKPGEMRLGAMALGASRR